MTEVNNEHEANAIAQTDGSSLNVNRTVAVAGEGRLVICPTPLGNLGDMTPRAMAALKQADVVCCEDTRVTGKLLSALGIRNRLERLDEATISAQLPRLVERVLAGETIACASDAGMPGVSDPGQRLVDAVMDAGGTVEVLPGGTAVATAYVASGFPTQNFFFGAFFPRKAGERRKVLESLKGLDAVLVFYESPQRIVSALEAIAEAFPNRRVAVCRELTKVHEEVVRGRTGDVYAEFSRREREGAIKGEIVLVIEDANDAERAETADDLAKDAAARAAELLADSSLSRKDVVKVLRQELGLPRNEAYDLILSLSDR